MEAEPKIIQGGIAVDDRGTLSFANDFTFAGVKRFYAVKNFSKATIRAFHGHMKESKYAFVLKGSAILAAVKMTDTKKPSKAEKVNRFILSDKSPSLLFIPAGYANGFKALEEDTAIMFFSTSTIEDSRKDDYRFPYDYWGAGIWEIENR